MPEQGNPEGNPDEFELALRTWAAHDRIIAHAYSIAQVLLDLGPALADELQTAARVDDSGALREATADLLEAVDHELALRFF